MEEALILDNKYTEHSTVGLAQQWDQLDQLGMRMQHNLEQQIQARYTPTCPWNSATPKVANLRQCWCCIVLMFLHLSLPGTPLEWRRRLWRSSAWCSSECLWPDSIMTYYCVWSDKSHPHLHLFICRHFDKEKSGRLNHQEFKSCLRSLGYDLPMVEEGEPDPEFESILDTVDPNRSVTCLINELFRGVKCQQYGCVVFRILLCLLPNYEEMCGCRDGNVSLQEYMAFMISRETENVKSSEEIESAFRALSTENKPYVTKEELYQVRCVHCSLCGLSLIVESSWRSKCRLLLFRTLPRSRQTTASHTWSPTSTARAASCHQLSTLSNSPAHSLSTDPSPTSDQSGCVFPHTHFHTNTWLKLHDCDTRNTH